MNERSGIGAKLISTHIILPVGLSIASFFISSDAFLFYTLVQSLLFVLYFSGYWEFFGLRFRKIFCAAFELLLLAILYYKIIQEHTVRPNLILIIILAIVQTYILIEIIKIIVVIKENNITAFQIEFPFRNGTYLVTDGGNSKISRLMNYHFYSPVHKRNKTNNSMLYATDIVKIVSNRRKFLPTQNDNYGIFGEKLFSPIDGEVVKVADSIDDNIPYKGNYPYNTGNTVVIRQNNLYLLLGHLKKGTIKVKEGDNISSGDPVAEAGNSGLSERPHLHMQLMKSETLNYWKGTGICIKYGHKNLYKNRLIEM